MNQSFYKAFEDQYRGSCDEIKRRLCVYLPFVQAITTIYPHARILDIGCGRGEWLSLLRENNQNAYGVDLDEGMLSMCREMALEVHCEEAYQHLKGLSDASLAVISAFHLVEHISFEQLQGLVQEALRVLKPGGLLMMETPNPENTVVATTSFYLDPTHIKPIPPQLLLFLSEYVGFKKNKLLRLQESVKDTTNTLSLWDVLAGASPDYAVIGQKNADQRVLCQTNSLFEKEYGLLLADVVKQYDEKMQKTRLETQSMYRQYRRILAPYRFMKRVFWTPIQARWNRLSFY